MKFRTEIRSSKSPLDITHEDHIMCVGSCFAEHIGARLERLKFPTHTNPFGIIYNPISVAQTLNMVLEGKSFEASLLTEHNGLWHSFIHHGDFSNPNRIAALEGINDALNSSHHFLKKTNRLILTLGTAYVFQSHKTGTVVANCHKFPNTDFERKRLSVEEVTAALFPVLVKLRNALPQLEVIATVSPVRHLRDGMVENQRSKATLVLSLEKLVEELSFVHYFPSFELVLDDLRDYRFFETDLAHPNHQAIEYVWNHFVQTFLPEKSQLICHRIERLVTASEHRPLHPDTKAHQAFMQKQLTAISEMEKEFPNLDFTGEKKKMGGGG